MRTNYKHHTSNENQQIILQNTLKELHEYRKHLEAELKQEKELYGNSVCSPALESVNGTISSIEAILQRL